MCYPRPICEKKRGRPPIGQNITVRLTKEQVEWIESRVVPGRINRSEVLRRLVDVVMNGGTSHD